MNAPLLIKGLSLGFVLAFPIGPIGLLCFRYSIIRGRTAGLIAGLGAATADVVYASLAAFGLSFILNPLMAYQQLFKILGGGIVSLFGMYLVSHGSPARTHISFSNPLVNYFSTFLLTLSNPMTLAMFVAFFTVLGIEDSNFSSLHAITLIFGVFAGSFLGWFSLTMLAHLFRGSITLETLGKINKTASIAIILFGMISILSALI